MLNEVNKEIKKQNDNKDKGIKNLLKFNIRGKGNSHTIKKFTSFQAACIAKEKIEREENFNRLEIVYDYECNGWKLKETSYNCVMWAKNKLASMNISLYGGTNFLFSPLAGIIPLIEEISHKALKAAIKSLCEPLVSSLLLETPCDYIKLNSKSRYKELRNQQNLFHHLIVEKRAFLNKQDFDIINEIIRIMFRPLE
jgi:hypothetical protein